MSVADLHRAATLRAQRGYDADWLGGTFSRAVFVGNGLVAIVSGLVAHSLVETLALGPVAPFDAAAVVMLVGGAVVAACWSENYGDSSDKKGFAEQLQGGARAIARGAPAVPAGSLLRAPAFCLSMGWQALLGSLSLSVATQAAARVSSALVGAGARAACRSGTCGPACPARCSPKGSHVLGMRAATGVQHKTKATVSCADPKIALLGAMQSLFEGSMYTFVFLWTPALSPAGEHLPHGMIFACFMVRPGTLCRVFRGLRDSTNTLPRLVTSLCSVHVRCSMVVGLCQSMPTDGGAVFEGDKAGEAREVMIELSQDDLTLPCYLVRWRPWGAPRWLGGCWRPS